MGAEKEAFEKLLKDDDFYTSRVPSYALDSAGKGDVVFSVRAMVVIVCIASSTSAWLSTSVKVTNETNFPDNEEKMAKTLKRYGRLSPPFYTLLFAGTLSKNPLYLIFFLAAGVPVCCVAMLVFIKPCHTVVARDRFDHLRFCRISAYREIMYVCFAAAFSILCMWKLSEGTQHLIFGATFAVMWLPCEVPLVSIFCGAKGAEIEQAEEGEEAREFGESVDGDDVQGNRVLEHIGLLNG